MNRRRLLLGSLRVFVLLMTTLRGPAQTFGVDSLEVLAPTIVLEQAVTSGSVVLELRNKSAAPVRVLLRADDFVSQTTGRVLAAKTMFADLGGGTAKEVYEATIGGQTTATVKASVADL